MKSPLPPGTRIGDYEIRSQLGAGAMGQVYLAQDKKLDRSVAVKILLPHLTADPDLIRRFTREAKATAALNHPNIAHLYQFGEESSIKYIAMEFVEGKTLRQRLNEGSLKILEALDILMQIASALSAAHSAGIIHRDLKPENVMLGKEGLAKVLDFGLVKLAEPTNKEVDREAPTRSMKSTQPGALLGTTAYMSPEQARGLNIDTRTDIFSLGILAYEMIAGCRPFDGKTPSDLIAAILEREPLPLVRVQIETPAELEWIITKALLKSQDERYQTAKDLLNDLTRLKHKLLMKREIERAVERDIVGIATLNVEGDFGRDKLNDAPGSFDGEPEHIRQISESLLERIQEVEGRTALLTGLSTGFKQLDALTAGLQSSELITLVAPPRIGASTLCINVIKNAAIQAEAKIVFFSIQQPKFDIVLRILCAQGLVNLDRFRSGFLTRSEWDNMARALGELAASKIFIDDSSDVSIKRLREKVLRISQEGRVDLVVVDFVQLLSDVWSEQQDPKSFGRAARNIKAVATEFNVPILAVLRVSEPFVTADISRDLPDIPEFPQYRMFEQFSDVVALMSQRNEFEGMDDNVVDISLMKNNHGPTSTVSLQLKKEFALFQDFERH